MEHVLRPTACATRLCIVNEIDTVAEVKQKPKKASKYNDTSRKAMYRYFAKNKEKINDNRLERYQVIKNDVDFKAKRQKSNKIAYQRRIEKHKREAQANCLEAMKTK
jgi:hypothetical protein